MQGEEQCVLDWLSHTFSYTPGCYKHFHSLALILILSFSPISLFVALFNLTHRPLGGDPFTGIVTHTLSSGKRIQWTVAMTCTRDLICASLQHTEKTYTCIL